MGSCSGPSSSNAQQSSVGLANGISGNAPVPVALAGAIVDLNRSIRTLKSYYPKKNNDFKTLSNMNKQSKEDENESKDDAQILAAGGDMPNGNYGGSRMLCKKKKSKTKLWILGLQYPL